jgi:hypothetical protein
MASCGGLATRLLAHQDAILSDMALRATEVDENQHRPIAQSAAGYHSAPVFNRVPTTLLSGTRFCEAQ